MTRKGSQVQVLYGPPADALVEGLFLPLSRPVGGARGRNGGRVVPLPDTDRKSGRRAHLRGREDRSRGSRRIAEGGEVACIMQLRPGHSPQLHALPQGKTPRHRRHRCGQQLPRRDSATVGPWRNHPRGQRLAGRTPRRWATGVESTAAMCSFNDRAAADPEPGSSSSRSARPAVARNLAWVRRRGGASRSVTSRPVHSTNGLGVRPKRCSTATVSLPGEWAGPGLGPRPADGGGRGTLAPWRMRQSFAGGSAMNALTAIWRCISAMGR
jgi:hypothetical protein